MKHTSKHKSIPKEVGSFTKQYAVKMFFAFTFILAGCDQLDMNKEDGNTEDSGPKSVQSASLEDNIKVSILGTDPEKYVVQFSWPRIEDKKVLRIRLGRVLAEVQPTQTFFTSTVNHNQVLTYSFDVLDSKRVLERTITKTAVIPYDFVVRPDNSVISDNIKIEANRLYLSEETALFIDGKSVEISANEIYSKGGMIKSFATEGNEDATAPLGKDGRSGGNLVLTVNKLYGPLKVDLRGENGGQGIDGAPYDTRAAKGAPAGKGKGYGSPGSADSYCDYGADAGNGAAGADGRPGLPGGSGGNSGNVKVSVKQFLPLEGIGTPPTDEPSRPVVVLLAPGLGAKGGNPGPPQIGGLGGDGNNGSDWDCSGEKGQPGPDGKPGKPGEKGKDGQIGLNCIYIGSENINECSQ